MIDRDDCRSCALLRVKLAACERELAMAAAERAKLTGERTKLLARIAVLKDEAPAGLTLEPPRRRYPDNRKPAYWLFDALRKHGPMTGAQLAEATGRPEAGIYVHISNNRQWITKTKGGVGSHKLYSVRSDAPTAAEVA